MSKFTRHLVIISLALSGVALAGPLGHGKISMPEPVCSPIYVSLFGGGSFFDQGEHATNPQFLPPGITLSDQYDFDNGWIVGGAIGIRTAKNFRFELELSHSQAPADAFSFLATTPFGNLGFNGSLRGEVERTSLMVNAVKEFGSGRLHPYVGGGIGLTHVDVDLVGAIPLGGFFGLPAIGIPAFGDGVVFGYQAMAGLGYDVTDCLQAFLEYRVMGHGNLEDYLRILPGDLDLGWSQHLILGMRVSF